VSLIDRRSAAAQRDQLLVRLSPVAPEWSEAIRLRLPPHDGQLAPGDPVVAWEWRQLAQALDECSAHEVGPIIAEIGQLRGQLREQTTQLIDKLAWAAQSRKTTPPARQALSGYVELVKKIGKGTGRKAPRLREAARQQMGVARSAVPVWIAPLARVAEAFDPRTQRFDVVIIDEASQSDVLGLIAWYLGKQVVVVGDDRQVTPESVGDRAEDMMAMIDSHLRGIPNRELYDGQASIYQLASTAFRGVVRLREHFRCVPEIISFSNSLSYNGDILPLRDPSSAKVRPAVVPYRVEVAPTSERRANEHEALHLASLLVACLEQPEYEGLTFGAISLLGNDQAAIIEQVLRNAVSPTQYLARRILCGVPPHFQGDERDVVFLSMVDAPPESPPLPMRGDPGDRFKKRYNVAASRAKDQLWVVHSLDRNRDLKAGDLRWRLLEWASNPSGIVQQTREALQKVGSPFEADVIKRLVNAGYRVTPQHPVGAYRIDIVVDGDGNRLAIECDGGAYHSSDEQVRSDLDRQALLERMGWQFHRIRGSEFYRNPDGEVQRLFARLSDAGITPEARGGLEPEPDHLSGELIERIKNRAAQLRDQWSHFGAQSTDAYSSVGGSGARAAKPPAEETQNDSPKAAGSVWGRDGGPAEKEASKSEPIRENTDRLGRPPKDQPAREPVAPRTSPRSSVTPTPGRLDAVASAEDAAAYFSGRGLRTQDNRAKGGALWVYGSKADLAPEMATLRARNVRFTWSDKRNGWFCK
jgi:very-short-patch-repair endonuclease